MFALIKAGDILGRGILSRLWVTGQSLEQLPKVSEGNLESA